jgi:hypothetical protein
MSRQSVSSTRRASSRNRDPMKHDDIDSINNVAHNLPDNVYSDRAPVVNLVKYVSETERARIQWAWMADSRGDAKKKAVQGVDKSQVRPELLEVVRMMSSCTIQTQTVEPSYVMEINNVKMETDRHRSIATQIGAPREKCSRAAQVVEADIVQSSRRGLQLYSALEDRMTLQSGGEGGRGALVTGHEGDANAEADAELPSHYRPTCDIPYSAYPIFMPDATAQGVANRYGYISLPQHIVQLPPRRRRKFVSPTDVPYLYGSHDLELDDRTATHLQRAHSLWSQCAGFVPKY